MSVFLMLFVLTVPLAFLAVGVLWLIFIAVGIFEPGGQRWRPWKRTKLSYQVCILTAEEAKLRLEILGQLAGSVSEIASLEGIGQSAPEPSARILLRNGVVEESLTPFQTGGESSYKLLLATR